MPFDSDLAIKLPGTRYRIYGRFQGKKSQPLAIMVHGLTGNMDESLYRGGCEYLGARGYATFRLNLYGYPKDARRIVRTTLKIHARDLNAVVRYFRRKGFKKIFVVGHSYGGATILLSDASAVDGAALWDPTFDASFTRKKWGAKPARFIRELKAYLVDWGVWYLLGAAMVKEADKLNWKKIAEKFSVPTRIFCAGKGVLREGCKHYYKTLPGKKDLKIVDHATHYFNDRPGMEEKVYRLTYEWFEKNR